MVGRVYMREVLIQNPLRKNELQVNMQKEKIFGVHASPQKSVQ